MPSLGNVIRSIASTYLVGMFLSAPLFAADLKPLQEKAATAKSVWEKANAEWKKLQSQSETLNAELIQAKSAPAKAKQQIAKSEAELKTLRETLKKAEAAAAQAKKNHDASQEQQKKAQANLAAKPEDNTAKAVAKKAEEKLAATTKELTAKTDAVNQAKAAIKMAEDTIASAKKAVESAPKEIARIEMQIADLTKKSNAQKAALETSKATWVTHQKAVEDHLIADGKLVSFAETVAPIFAKRCVACHNNRSSQGRFNMETFAAITKGGESGAALEPGDPDSSNLYFMIEDGSMPKDADPLSKAEIASIKKWIATGATLDAGKDADAPLIVVMPKLPQPTPPETYRVPVPVTALAFSPDGKTLASSGYHEVLLWETETGTLIRRITNIAERVYDLKFSSDGESLAVAAGTPAQIGELKLFQVADGKLIGDFGISGDSIFALAWSPDGKRIASAGADRTIRVFDVATQKEQLSIEDHADWVMGLAFSPDGTLLASASRDKTAKLFNAETGDAVVTFNGHGQAVYDVGFSPDGKQVVSCGEDRQVRVWNPADAKEVRKIAGFGGEIFDLTVLKSGEVVTASADKLAHQHKLANGQALKTFKGPTDWIYAVAANTDAKLVAAGTYDGKIHLFRMDDGKEKLSFTAVPQVPDTNGKK